MPLFIDVHNVAGVKADDVAKAHEQDPRLQTEHGVNHLGYWMDEVSPVTEGT